MLFKTNLLVCFIIILGFIVVSTINHTTNQSGYMDNIEQISALTSEGIYYSLNAIFSKPVNISLAMSFSPLLRDFLLQETNSDDDIYVQTIKEYLNAYKEGYGYDSVFLVSAKTSRYYNYNGINRVLDKNNFENDWYYTFLESDEDYSLNVDNDEASLNEVTIFANCRIRGSDGTTLGVVGIGVRLNDFQSIFVNYASNYNADIYLINQDGEIEVAIDNNGYQPVNFFDVCGYPELSDEILSNRVSGNILTYWLEEQGNRNYVATQFIPEFNWHLIVEHNTSLYNERVERQLYKMALTAIATGFIVLITITYTINRYNKRIITLTASIEQEKQSAFRRATEQLYDNIYEFNITNNCAMGNHTRQYFEGLGISADTPYDKAIKVMAERNVKDEYQNDYILIFSPENVLQEFKKGNTGLQYDMLSSMGGTKFYWLRIMAHIYHRREDDSICMFTYYKNIDAEKRKEDRLTAKAQLDGLTNVFNKIATEYHIEQMLCASREDLFAFYIIDIDNFKQINDKYGHAFGDLVIVKFIEIVKNCFRSGDVIGRIGGDEFVAFLRISDIEWVNKKASELSADLDTEIVLESECCKISASIGVAISSSGASFKTLYKNADSALYETKRRGKNGFTVFGRTNA